MLRIEIAQQDAALGGGLIRAVKRTAKAATRLEAKTGRLAVSVLITDDENIRRLNRDFRQIDSATDVLSFPSDEQMFLGDIAISLPQAQEQARQYGHTLEREVAFLTAHAMLHLFGYDHMQEDEEQVMRAKQREILKKAGYER